MTKPARKRTIFRNKPYAALRIVGILLILGLIALRYNVWSVAVKSNRQISDNSFNENISVRDYALQHKFEVYADTLYSGRALFLADNSVTRQAWTDFVTAQNIQQRYPGVYAIAYVSVISESQEAGLLNTLNANRYPRETNPINIYPASKDSQLAVLTYIAPVSADQNTIGYNLFSNPARAAALDKARDTGTAQTTKPIALVSDKSNSPSSLLIVMPVYDSSKPTSTINERRVALSGFVVLALHTKPLLDSIFKIGNSVNVTISTNGQSIYNFGKPLKNHDIKKTTVLSVGGQKWQLNYSAPDTLGLSNAAKLTPLLLILSVIPLLILYLLVFYFSIKYYVLRRHHKESHHNQSSDHDVWDVLK